MSKKVTIIIPCFNQGHFLKDALESLNACDSNLFELIIVNDGSTDSFTNSYLKELSQKGVHVVFQENKGLGEARNTGIRAASCEYILPLDADNKIFPAYITKGIEILDTNQNVAVVYGNANYFGDKTGLLKPGEFNLQKLMLGNFIDACAVIRKSAVEKVGLYDNMKIMGYEDWDLWLRIAFSGFGFWYADETLFEYRVRKDSMMKRVNTDLKRQNDIEEYILNKYKNKLDFTYPAERFLFHLKQKPLQFLYSLVLKKWFPKVYEQKTAAGKLRKYFIYD